MSNAPKINPDQLWQDLMALACLGATAQGGCDRLSLTEADAAARNLFRLWCEDAGFTVRVDAMGNMFARLEGADPSLPPVLMGSHLDTQSPGGKFDGPLGVLAALEAARAIGRTGTRTRRAIEIVNWTNEEGARFAPGLMGSGVFAGAVTLEAAHAAQDRAGDSFGAALKRIRYLGEEPVGGREIDSYVELHVEQGPELERTGTTIAAVSHSNYLVYITVECLGANGHTQATHFATQRNALLGSAKALVEIERIATTLESRAAVSQLDVWPNNRVNVPHRTTFSVMMVEPQKEKMLALRGQILAALDSIGTEMGLTFTIRADATREPVIFPEEMVTLIEDVSKDLGHSVMRLSANTGHDALSMGPICPTALIFVPSRDGISHSDYEYTSPDHCAAGAEVLMHAVLRRANRT
ncbi:M20 family metallo-hydrolase [Acidisoma cellulosilytica]|uniref:M20 family metallo-hydrolase n=1 Tax=Acidisoma cellulosilyticum TaxID=2802395 RepID=A0A963Z3Q1_9PROT|nr:M20 family metallo-hydrolase [Acidisoma cellulosilyticum]MCB8882325.1 M20 family metallo-hydrolase [Acidisoma cellulosilyticum]